MSERIERRDCPTHGPVDARVTYEDNEGPVGVVLVIECPRCVDHLAAQTDDPWMQPVASGPVRYYDTDADMPPAMQARIAEDRRALAAATSRYEKLLAALPGRGWPAAAVSLVAPHRPRREASRTTCQQCEGDDWQRSDAWPCWVVLTAEGS